MKTGQLVFFSHPLGLNTVLSPLYSKDEFADVLNLKYSRLGKWVGRQGLKKISSNPTSGAVKNIEYIPIDGNNYIFLVDANYNLYKCSGDEPNIDPGISLGPLEGSAWLIPFNNKCIILDGGYIKQCDGSEINLAYDNGEGLSGYLYNNVCPAQDEGSKLYSGGNTKVGSNFTTPLWGSGKLPLLSGDIWISKTGSPSGDVTISLYDSTGATCLATSDPITCDELTLSAMQRRFYFDGSYQLSPNTSYKFVLEFSGGDADNYIVAHTFTANPGDMTYYNGSSWADNTTKSVKLGIKPGLPPKGSFGAIRGQRLFVGGDPDHRGYLWYSNLKTAFDWSTSPSVLVTNTGYDYNGGGFLTVSDSEGNVNPIGGIISHFGDLIVFGTKERPFIAKLTGVTPKDFALNPINKQSYTGMKTLKGCGNNIWFTSSDSVHYLYGVQSYGDLRSKSPGDPIRNLIQQYYNESAFAEYNPVDGQYWLKLDGYDKILVCEVNPILTSTGEERYPWTQYLFKNIAPTCFATFNDKFYVGASDGYLYRLDDTVITDDGSDYDITVKSGIVESYGLSGLVLDSFIDLIHVTSFNVKIYKNENLFTTLSLSGTYHPISRRIRMLFNSIYFEIYNVEYDNAINLGIVGFNIKELPRR